MKLSDMRDLLARHDIQLTKSLGQNFLHDAHQLDRIVATAELSKADKVLEIGPGLGPLTERLLDKAGEVLAIEKDARLVPILRERFGSELKCETPALTPALSHEERAGVRENDNTIYPHRLSLLHDDALDFLKREPRDWHDWKLVANLPYSVASPILVELAAGMRAPKMIVATLQLEVAQRLMAQTDDDDYGVLTLLVQLDFEPRGWFQIPPGCFFPPPDVNSACVRLVRRAVPLLPEPQRKIFHRLVKQSFSQRRKMMLKLL
ncbi:MAG TPA: 16S rRNA (adenine(1518)-N(6)/adenine(1519)-N(6))-dimethyltransferase RsmA, partial [Candidatus Binatia bacterium]|nr:16S rRNA (adenine(1518)-N(6)/adenine(1519)-N(6))-dimethyltransferase RsmA [Candidatus Binatia bacterium]